MEANPYGGLPNRRLRAPRPAALLMFLLGITVYLALATDKSARAIHDSVAMPGWHPECICEYSNLEVAIWHSLSLASKSVLYTQSCCTQRKILGVLAQVPREERDEVIARALDRAFR